MTPLAALLWQNGIGQVSFVVELLPDAAARRYANAVLRLAG